MRILQIGMHDQLGGIESFMMNYYKHIDKSKFQFDFVIPYKDGGYYDNEILKLGGKIYYLSIKNDKNIFKFFKETNQIFEKNHYDIVHCSDSGLGIFYLYFAKKNKCKIRIAHSHATSVERGIKGIIKKIFEKEYIKLANVYFACSTEAGKYLFKNNNFEIIKNGIDYERFRYNSNIRNKVRNDFNIKEDEILIGNIGRFCEQKNQIFLLDILTNLDKKYKLMLIGDGPLKQNLKDIIENNNIENRVILLNSQRNIESYYNAFDVFCLPSIYEGLPIVGIEAQVNGLTCLFSNNISQEVKMNNNCIFLNNKLKKKKNAIENSNCREKNISNCFDIKKNAIELELIYNKLLKNMR